MIHLKGEVDRWECVYRECKAKCCKPAKITLEDVRRISKALGVPPEDFIEPADEGGLFKLKAKNGSCCFLLGDYKCELHRRKTVPLPCRMFPFLLDSITYADDIIVSLKPASGCPGYGRGRKVGEEFKEHLERLGSQFTREIEQCLKLKRDGLSLSEMVERLE